MSESAPTPAPPKRRRLWRWLKRITIALGVLLLLAVAVALAVRAYFIHQANERLESVVADLDQKDPRWRWDDILADREAVPEEENGARHVLAAAQFIPQAQGWPENSAAPPKPPPEEEADSPGMIELSFSGGTLLERLESSAPVEYLDEELTADLRAELKALAPAVIEARKLANSSKGRYDVTWSKDFMSTGLPHTAHIRNTAILLQMDAALQAEEGDCGGALLSALSAVNAGRTFGDEPCLVSVLMRIGTEVRALRVLERVLAQGELPDTELARFEKPLEDELAQKLFLQGYRGERAAYYELFGRIYEGEVNVERLAKQRSDPPSTYGKVLNWAYYAPLARYNQSFWLEYTSRIVDVAESPRSHQKEVFAQLDAELKGLKNTSPKHAYVFALMPAFEKFGNAYHGWHAHLHLARTAIALERYRLAHGQWPDSLEQLCPRFLPQVPLDPFDDKPLRYHRLDDGVLLYSVAYDGEDNDGLTDQASGIHPGTDLGFRLWNPEHRRQAPPPKPEPIRIELPQPVEEDHE